jgi:hypothetical protein
MIMSNSQKKIRSVVRRDGAENYLLISLVAFGVMVIFPRVFLQLTGFPQIGNGVPHIANALWGGLLLFIAVLLPLELDKRWAIQASTLLGGIGIGLFIDEVGKFITQTNDYFYPPALCLLYSFFLQTTLVYLYFRRSRQENPRNAMYHVLEGLQDALDGDLDQEEAATIEAQLAIAKGSYREENLSLADAINSYLHQEKGDLATAADLAEKHELPISQARVHLAHGDTSAALAVLGPLRQQVEAKGWEDERLKVMVLQAVVQLEAVGRLIYRHGLLVQNRLY